MQSNHSGGEGCHNQQPLSAIFSRLAESKVTQILTDTPGTIKNRFDYAMQNKLKVDYAKEVKKQFCFVQMRALLDQVLFMHTVLFGLYYSSRVWWWLPWSFFSLGGFPSIWSMVYCLGKLLPLARLVTGGLTDALCSCIINNFVPQAVQEIRSNGQLDATVSNLRSQSTGPRGFWGQGPEGIAGGGSTNQRQAGK